MLERLRSHLTYANVMSTLAAFAAIGGGVAWAIETNSVKSKHIVNGQVKAVDIKDGDVPDDATTDAVNAARLDGVESDGYVGSQVPLDGPNTSSLDYQSRFLDTATTGSSFEFGLGLVIENVGVADQFRVCAQGNAIDAVVYVGATRTQVAVPASTCSTNFTIPDDGDFRISGSRAQVFGVYSGNSEDAYLLHGLEPG
jgi:hypothetical protein